MGMSSPQIGAVAGTHVKQEPPNVTSNASQNKNKLSALQHATAIIERAIALTFLPLPTSNRRTRMGT